MFRYALYINQWSLNGYLLRAQMVGPIAGQDDWIRCGPRREDREDRLRSVGQHGDDFGLFWLSS